MGTVFITRSADGLGVMAAELPLRDGHAVTRTAATTADSRSRGTSATVDAPIPTHRALMTRPAGWVAELLDCPRRRFARASSV